MRIYAKVVTLIISLFLIITFNACSEQKPPDDPQDSPVLQGCIRVPPNSSGTPITVRNITELLDAVGQANATGNVTILLEDGTYVLDDMLWISGEQITFRSRSGNRDAVVIRGQGMYGSVSHIFNVSGSFFTAADVTLGWVSSHGIQIHSDSDNPVIHNIRFVNTGEQMLKVSYRPGDSTSSENGLVEWCVFEYPAGVGPQYYIGGIDAHQAFNWVVRYNIFRHIRSPESDLAEHAIHFWSDSSDTLIEHNMITNCDRGIGLGLGDRGHWNGMIRNNMVHTTRDVGIGLESAEGAAVYNNTVYTENYDNSIEYRFPETQGVLIMNNLTNGGIASRDGGSASVSNNMTGAHASWFVSANTGDLHLLTSESAVVDQGRFLPDVLQDIDCQFRPQGSAYDIGADEVQ